MSINVCTRAEKDAIAEAIGNFRFTAGFGRDAVPAGPARHRRAPRRHAAEVPPAGGDARPGRPAQGDLRHRHPRRRHQRADPHGAVHRTVQVRRCEDPAAQGPRVPPDRRPGRAGRVRHHRHGRGAGARARHRQRAGAGQGRRRPEEAAQGGPQEAAGGLDRLGPAHLRPAGRGRAGAADVAASRSATRCCSTCIGRPGDAFAAMRHLLTDNHEEPAAQRRHIRRAIAIYRALLAGGVVERLPSPTPTAGRSGSPSTCSSTSRSTSRCRRSRWPRSSCSTGSRRPTPSTCCRSSSPPWTIRGRCCPRSSSRPAARRSPR